MFEEILRLQCQLDPALPLLAGVSGGPDSLCLLDILHTAGYRLIVAHFNHKLRPEADQESAAVAERARAMNLPFVSDSADVRAWAGEQQLSIEEAARELRYRFLFSSARRLNAQAVAVGHTADDQVETVLMHFLRGAGLVGLKGMEIRTLLPIFDPQIPLVRPLLSLWRVDTESYCREHGLAPHFDPSNTDETFYRNRLRHTLIPELEKYNPRFKDALVRSALALQGDYAVLKAEVETIWEIAVAATGTGWVAFHPLHLWTCAPGLQRALIRRAAQLLRPGSRDIGFEALERAVSFLSARTRKRVDFINGLYLVAEGGRIYLAAYEADLPSEARVAVDGERFLETGIPLPLDNGWVLTSEECSPEAGDWTSNSDPWSAWLDRDRTGDRFMVRPRREGDVFKPLGMGGQTVKVREFFINSKVPKRAREKWPLVCLEDQVVWIPGIRIAHPVRITGKTKRLLKLTLRKTRV